MHDKPQFSFSTAFSLGWTAMSAHYRPLGFPVIGLPGGTCPECGGPIVTA